jgi:hypothetical protein
MMDTNAIEVRIKWLHASLAASLDWGLDENTQPNLLKHCTDTIDAMQRELAQLTRDLKHAKEINERVAQ